MEVSEKGERGRARAESSGIPSGGDGCCPCPPQLSLASAVALPPAWPRPGTAMRPVLPTRDAAFAPRVQLPTTRLAAGPHPAMLRNRALSTAEQMDDKSRAWRFGCAAGLRPCRAGGCSGGGGDLVCLEKVVGTCLACEL